MTPDTRSRSVGKYRPASSDARNRERSYARDRLRLGITGVGTSVVLAAAWLIALGSGLIDLPEGWHPLEAPSGRMRDSAITAVAVFLLHAVILLPTEFSGGMRAVRQRPRFIAWLGAWLRGLSVQALIFALVAATMAGAAIAYEDHAIVPAAVTAAITVLLLALQGPIARVVARLPLRQPDTQLVQLAGMSGLSKARIEVVDAPDEGFVGGWIGLLNPVLWVPAHWTEAKRASLLAVEFARRAEQLALGLRGRGVLLTVLWNTLGTLLLTQLLPWDFDEPRTYLVLPAAATLWSFLSVLVLPTPSRQSVYATDRAVADAIGKEPVAAAITQLDRWQDDEAERSPGVERIFHPVPSRGNRLRALDEPRRWRFGAHQLTRLVLYSATAMLSPLGRVVHCNVGRPSLWVVYPGD